MVKNREVKNFLVKIFVLGIYSESFEIYFKMKISKSKFFSRYKTFAWDLIIFSLKWWTMAKSKIFGPKKFFVEIDSECFERYLKRKSRERKIFSVTKFFPGT